MRVLQIVKTTDGAKWAVDQARELCAHGVELHVALPNLSGRLAESWEDTGASLHCVNLDMPVRRPWELHRRLRAARRLVERISPQVIHSHFFGPSLLVRYALGRHHPIRRLFQVPGPLHLEHALYRHWELSSAGPADYWIASSRYIKTLYEEAGIQTQRLFLSYYGSHLENHDLPREMLRQRLGIGADERVVGNINYMYPPKYFLGQTRGLKRHEDVIDALGLLVARRDNVTGVLIGGQWGRGTQYEERLRRRAFRVGGKKILMPGQLEFGEAAAAWSGYDLAVHVPASENCGGVVEPLLAGVPVIASRTGGLPEVVLDGITGSLVAGGNPQELADTMERTLDHLSDAQQLAAAGRHLVRHMFDVRRTAREVLQIYEYLSGAKTDRPTPFDAAQFLADNPAHAVQPRMDS